MRTVLDIDEDVLDAAKEIASTRKQSTGKVISNLAREALAAGQGSLVGGPAGSVLKAGWYVLPRRGGIVTTDLVDRLLEESEREDPGSSER